VLEAQKASRAADLRVLSETDVINMVCAEPAGEILRGVHDSIAQRLRGCCGRRRRRRGRAHRRLASDIGLKGALERQLAPTTGRRSPSRRIPGRCWPERLAPPLAHHRHQKLAERKAQPAVAHPA